MLNFPAFGEQQYFDNQSNERNRVVMINGVPGTQFDLYSDFLIENGFKQMEASSLDFHKYGAYCRGENGIFLNYFTNTQELSIVTEEHCRYFSYEDTCLDAACAPQITHPKLETYGMSEIIRLSDGRYILFDGGRQLAPDADTIFNTITAGSPHETPVIAAWFLTHPHADHYNCFFDFYERYKDRVKIEKFFYNFPRTDDYDHYPSLINVTKHNPTLLTETEKMQALYALIADSGAETYTPHTGQTYRIGDAVCQVLATLNDTIHVSGSINATSLVIRMELGGQVILWTGDAAFSASRFAERYGDYLKADILQVPHHGFTSGTDEAQIAAFDLIKPQVCLLPAHDYYAYGTFCIFKKAFNHLVRNGGVQEMITGETTRTLTLPYSPVPYGAKELQEKFQAGWANAGACSWVFMGLNTARKRDFVFTFLNSTNQAADIEIELFFDEASRNVRRIKSSVGRNSTRTICITNPEHADSDSFFFNPWGLKFRGIPKRAEFGVRFYCSVPVVVAHKKHPAAFHS